MGKQSLKVEGTQQALILEISGRFMGPKVIKEATILDSTSYAISTQGQSLVFLIVEFY